MALAKEKEIYTFADYLAWDGESRIEIMDGQLIMMAPPSRLHQEISGEIFAQLHNFLDGKKCRVYAAPFAVRLFEENDSIPEDIQTVFEPDISVVCDMSKLDEHGCKGAPDMVVEILSPSTAKRDLFFKMWQYRRSGVKEYWVVSPNEKNVAVYTLDDDYKVTAAYNQEDVAKVHVLPGCFIELAKVFTE